MGIARATRPGRRYVSPMPRPAIILFDLDGTLIDSVRLILDSYHHTLRSHGLPARTDDEWLSGLGTPLTAQLADWGDDPEKLQALIATYREYNLEHHDRMVSVYPGVVEAVSAIRAAGVRTGLVTSKNRNGALRGLTLARLDKMMDVLVCADEVTNPKPHPEPVEKAVALLGGRPGRHDLRGRQHSRHAVRTGGGYPYRRSALGPVRARSPGRSGARLLAGDAPRPPAPARLVVQDLSQPADELFHGEGLLYESRAGRHGTIDGNGPLAVPRHEQHLESGMPGPEALHQLPAAHLRHDHVGEDQVESLARLLRQPQRLERRAGLRSPCSRSARGAGGRRREPRLRPRRGAASPSPPEGFDGPPPRCPIRPARCTGAGRW